MPDQLYSLTLFELQSLVYHHERADREHRYACNMANFDKDTGPKNPVEWYKLPGDPGWEPPEPEPTLEEHIEFMRSIGEWGPTED